VSDDFIRLVAKRTVELKSFNKKTIFTISTTAKKEEHGYLTPIRVCKDFVVSGCVIFDQQNLATLLEKIDGKISIILCDSEKKIPLYSDFLKPEIIRSSNQLSQKTISNICFKHINKSLVFEFKPNDLTVNAVWSFLSQHLEFVSGKKICILGAGNIGSKLALKLVECGAEVHVHRRNISKGVQVVKGLNLIKPEGINASIIFQTDPILASLGADVLIGASNGVTTIDESIINNVNKNCLIVDLGKNNLSKNAIKTAHQLSLSIWRADVSPAIESFIYEVLRMESILKNSYGGKSFGFCNVVGGGFFGGYGDVVVDNIENPKLILGICQGNGSLKTLLNNEDNYNIERIKKEFKIEI